MADKFHFSVGDTLQVDSTKSGSGQYGDWQYIKVKSPDGKTNPQIFLTEIVENLHDGDYVKVEGISVYPRRAKVESPKGELVWSTIFKVDIKVSIDEEAGGFDVEGEQLPF